MKSTQTVLAVAIVIGGTVGMAFSQDEGDYTTGWSFTADSLKGKPGVYVRVFELGQQMKATGLSRQQLTTEVEMLLRKFGVPVRKHGDYGPDILFDVSLAGNAVTRGDGNLVGYYCIVSCDVLQPVRLHRIPSIKIFDASTWRAVRCGGFAPSKSGIKKLVTSIVEEKTKQFINAYLEANPK